jgi:hypothetical protein
MSDLLIQCSNDGWAPWAIVCTHLMDGESREWVPIDLSEDDKREIDSDWLCPECAEKLHEENIDNLRPVCIHCLRKIRKQYDPQYEEPEIETEQS